jgi:hypothetical protein
MSNARDVEQARRNQLWLSVVVTSVIAALAAAVTWVMVLRDDLPLLVQIAISLVFWAWVVWSAWEFRKIYVRMGVASETPRIDT